MQCGNAREPLLIVGPVRAADPVFGMMRLFHHWIRAGVKPEQGSRRVGIMKLLTDG